MWDYPDSIDTYGVGYELRNCKFAFDLENILPRLLPANYCSHANPQRPWHQGNEYGLLTMGVCVYNADMTEKLLSAKELEKQLQTDAQATDFQVYARLNLHEKISADGGIQLSPSLWLKGLWKVTNLPGNSGACFFDQFEMSRVLAQKYAETGMRWLVLPWDADALYLVDPAEVEWQALITAMREELEIEYPSHLLHVVTDQWNLIDDPSFWLVPRHSIMRQFYSLDNGDWREVPPFGSDSETAVAYINYRSQAIVNTYATAGIQNLAHHYILQLHELSLVVAEIAVGEPTLLPRCDWIALPDAPTPLCKLNALETVGVELVASPDSSPTVLQIPALTKRQVKKLQRFEQWRVAEACEIAVKALREHERYAS